MAPTPVEAVWFFRWKAAVSQATYNRIAPPPGQAGAKKDQRYTKNHLQVSGQARELLDDMLDRDASGEVPILWRWPGGAQPGVAKANSQTEEPPRALLTWGEGGKAPATFKLGAAEDKLTTIVGGPDATTIEDADAALEAVRDRGESPWLLVVKLRGEERVLHARAYLERPQKGREHTALVQLPSGLLDAIKQLPDNTQTGWYKPEGADPPAPRAKQLVEQIQASLERDPNVLLVGPPGTGKTVALEDLRAIVEHADSPITFNPERVHDAFGSAGGAGKVISLVFHPSYAYEDFVAGLIPESDQDGLRLIARPGPLVNLAHWAGADPDRRALLILDEFNRGPTAAIFGDTLALLDASKRHTPGDGSSDGAHITRPFPGQQMKVPAEFAGTDGGHDVSAELRLPSNVQIVAALNSSDRSVAPLDAAMRRRFAILPVNPDLDVFAAHLNVSWPDDRRLADDPNVWTADDVRWFSLKLLDTLNDRIGFVLSDDFLLGHAFLWPIGDADEQGVRGALCDAFDNRIAQSLRLTFTDQDELLGAVLGAGDPENPSDTGVATWTLPPDALAGVAAPRLTLRSVAVMSWPDASRALRQVID